MIVIFVLYVYGIVWYMYFCMYIHVRMYVCMYVCMYVYMIGRMVVYELSIKNNLALICASYSS
jgi:hypothetical protein